MLTLLIVSSVLKLQKPILLLQDSTNLEHKILNKDWENLEELRNFLRILKDGKVETSINIPRDFAT